MSADDKITQLADFAHRQGGILAFHGEPGDRQFEAVVARIDREPGGGSVVLWFDDHSYLMRREDFDALTQGT